MRGSGENWRVLVAEDEALISMMVTGGAIGSRLRIAYGLGFDDIGSFEMTLTHRGLDQNSFGPDLNLYLWADDGDLAVRFVIPHVVFVEAFNGHPPVNVPDRFQELLVTVRAACDWAYEREKHGLKVDSAAADVVVSPNDFLKARKWLAIGAQVND